MKPWQHLKTICHHRRLVRQGGAQVGLYWQGLTHDLSKFSPHGVLERGKVFSGQPFPQQRPAGGGRGTAWPGCTIRAATAIIMNTGPISSPARESTAGAHAEKIPGRDGHGPPGRPA